MITLLLINICLLIAFKFLMVLIKRGRGKPVTWV